MPPPPEANADGGMEGEEPQRRNLRAEATNLAHLLVHKPKNPYCPSCSRAMMSATPRRHGSFHNEAKA
eukprot:9774384-Lingulodinium_polyedra.AAC.1